MAVGKSIKFGTQDRSNGGDRLRAAYRGVRQGGGHFFLFLFFCPLLSFFSNLIESSQGHGRDVVCARVLSAFARKAINSRALALSFVSVVSLITD